MRFLLTSAGIKNTSIENALVDLLGNRLPSPAPCAFPPGCTGTRWSVLAGGHGSSSPDKNPSAP